MTIDHTSIQIHEAEYDACLALYLKALAPLGYQIQVQFGPTITGLGAADAIIGGTYKAADLWLMGVKEKPANTTHLALRAKGKNPMFKRRS